jgi:hypothetical protein
MVAMSNLQLLVLRFQPILRLISASLLRNILTLINTNVHINEMIEKGSPAPIRK